MIERAFPIVIEGFHGTSKENALNILASNFKPSIGDEEWLGDGVYFFTEGIPPPPQDNATKWAIVSAWDNRTKTNKYMEYAVLRSIVKVKESKFLDLTSNEGIKIFNYLRNKYAEILSKKGRVKSTKAFKDGHIINQARIKQGMSFDVIKGHFYIKFEKERKLFLNFRTPNTTILAVANVNTIDAGETKIIKIKQINNEA